MFASLYAASQKAVLYRKLLHPIKDPKKSTMVDMEAAIIRRKYELRYYFISKLLRIVLDFMSKFDSQPKLTTGFGS